jgi:hypothetical protein
MPLNYRLSADSPLKHPDAPERIFSDPDQYASAQRMQDLRELGFGPDKYCSDRYHSNAIAGRVYSVLTQEEIDELLTPAGTVWFLSYAMDLDVWKAARLYETGTPWPLRAQDDDVQWAAGNLNQGQMDYLCRLFQPVGRHAQIIIELESNGWEAPNEPDGGPVKRVRAYWKHIAKEAKEDIRMVRLAALVLHYYYDCVRRFVKQQELDRFRIEGKGRFLW